MNQPITEYVRDLHLEVQKTLASAAIDCSPEMGRLLQIDLDILAWEKRLAKRPEVRQLADARRELGFALYAAASGLYVHAYAGLRVFLELSVASVHFSANELHRRRWIADREDFSWRKALSEDDGVWSADFVKEFYAPGVSDAAKYAEKVAASYRHCSQFMHGKLSVREQVPPTLAYARVVLIDWLAMASNAAEAVLYLIFVRYGEELLPEDDGKLLTIIQEWFGHMPHVRDLLGSPVDRESRRGI